MIYFLKTLQHRSHFKSLLSLNRTIYYKTFFVNISNVNYKYINKNIISNFSSSNVKGNNNKIEKIDDENLKIDLRNLWLIYVGPMSKNMILYKRMSLVFVAAGLMTLPLMFYYGKAPILGGFSGNDP